MSNEQLAMSNERAKLANVACCLYSMITNNDIAHCSFLIANLIVLVMEMRRRRSSLQSLIMLSYSFGDNRFISLSKSSQYSVSAHSLSAIVALARNSFLLIEYCASLRFAPIDVPERNNCLASVNSCFSSHRYLYKLYILIANLRLFSNATFSIPLTNIQNTKLKSNERKG